MIGYIMSIILLYRYILNGQTEPYVLLASALFAIAGAIQMKS